MLQTSQQQVSSLERSDSSPAILPPPPAHTHLIAHFSKIVWDQDQQMEFLVPAQKQEYVKVPCTNSHVCVSHTGCSVLLLTNVFPRRSHSTTSCWRFHHTLFFSFFTIMFGWGFLGFFFACMCFCFWIGAAWGFFHSLLTKQILFYLFTLEEFCYYSDFHNFNCGANVWKMSF